jgi:hypothetical protein
VKRPFYQIALPYLAILLLVVTGVLVGYLSTSRPKIKITVFNSVIPKLYPGIGQQNTSLPTTNNILHLINGNPVGQVNIAVGQTALILGSFGQLVQVNLGTQKVISQIATGAAPPQNPYALSFNNLSKLAVVLSLGANMGNAAVIVNTSIMKITHVVTLPFAPVASASDPINGNFAYVTGAGGQLALLNISSGTLVKEIQLVDNPFAYLDAIAITPDGRIGVVLDNGGESAGNVAILVKMSTLSAYYQVILTNDPGAFLDAVAITPDGKYAWVLNGGYGNGFTQSIELPSGVVNQPISVGGGPLDIVIDPNNQTAYSINGATGNGNLIVPVNINPNYGAPQPTGGTPIEVEPNTNLYLDDGFVIGSSNTLYVLDRDSGDLIPINLSTDVPGKGFYTVAFAVCVVLE